MNKPPSCRGQALVVLVLAWQSVAGAPSGAAGDLAVPLFAWEVAQALLQGLDNARENSQEDLGNLESMLPALAPHLRRLWWGGGGGRSSSRFALIDLTAGDGGFLSTALHLFTTVAHRRAMLVRGGNALESARARSPIDVIASAVVGLNTIRDRATEERWELVAHVSMHYNLSVASIWEAWSTDAPKGRISFLRFGESSRHTLRLLAYRGLLEHVDFLGIENTRPGLDTKLLAMLRHRGFACFLVHAAGLLPLFAGIAEHAVLVFEKHRQAYPKAFRHLSGAGDIFCGRGCDEGLVAALRLLYDPDEGSPQIQSQPLLAPRLLAQEFPCEGESLQQGEEEKLIWDADVSLAWLEGHGACSEINPHTLVGAVILGRRLVFDSPWVGQEARERGRKLIRRASGCDPWAALLWGSGW